MPADSILAHRASGVQGALLKMADMPEKKHPISRSTLESTISKGYQFLEASALGKKISENDQT